MMDKFENVNCDLCGSDNTINLYSSKQHGDGSIGSVDIKIVMCKECNFIYQNPQLSSETLTNHYKRNSSGDIFRLTQKETRAGILLDERKQFIEETISLLNIKNICDIGGGSGELISSLEMPEKVKRFLIEPSNAIYKNKDHKVLKINKRIEDIHDIELPKFNFLMCISTLEHLKNPLSVLHNFNKLLSADGFLLIEVPNSLKPYAQYAEYFTYEHVNHFTYKTLIAFLSKAGFYPVKMEESKSTSTIRIVARNYNKTTYTSNIIQLFKQYQQLKRNFAKTMSCKIENKIHKVSSFSVYGAGDHTRAILEKFNFLDKIEYFIDSDPNKWGERFYDKEIISPENISALKLKNILIYSHDFEDEIYDTIKRISPGINIITIYRGDTH